MHEAKRKSVIVLLVCVFVATHPPWAGAFGRAQNLRAGIVKIYVTRQRPDYTMPWLSRPPASGTGSAFIISRRRLLTNAHVVSDARFLEVQKQGDPRRYKAEVKFIAHDCDLAMLHVPDPAFFNDTEPLPLAKALPDLTDEVTVLGYPMGGVRLSITRGVVSRIDYSTYTHSGVDRHLVLQVDAAINPGNSGGPVVFDDRVVGLAFQGLSWAENIGYAIPLPVIQHFLADVNDGVYHGYPELGVAHLSLRNPALRADLGVPPDRRGIAVTYVDPYGSAHDRLQLGDVIMAVDGHDVADDGTVEFEDNRVLFAELIERKQWGATVMLEVWRDEQPRRITIPLTNPPDPFVFRREYNTGVRYLVRGGLVFSPLSREYLLAQRRRQGPHGAHLAYFFEYAKMDDFYKRFDEFVVLIRRLPHAINAYAEPFVNSIVTHVNDREIRRLEDIRAAWETPVDGGFHTIRFAGHDDTLVLSAEAAKAAHAELLRGYSVSDDAYLEDTP